jgi:hypothetical protein
MMLRRWGLVGVVAAVVALGLARAAEQAQFGYAAYADVLTSCVDDAGLVDYGALKADRAGLDRFARQVADLEPAVYEKWSDNEKIAFWINAYNALTLKAVIDHYPIRPGFSGPLIYPKESVRQVPGFWGGITFPVMGRQMTLDAMEDLLRRQFRDPRVHMALTCAAMGGPKLRAAPYTGTGLDEQFADQTRRFVTDHQALRINQERSHVALSAVMQWFGEDFVERYGTSMEYVGHGASERAILHYLSPYLGEQDRAYLEHGDYEVKYLPFDWALNAQQATH